MLLRAGRIKEIRTTDPVVRQQTAAVGGERHHAAALGFMMTTHIGLDFPGTYSLDPFELSPMTPWDVCNVDFHVQRPVLYHSAFSFTPAIVGGTLYSYRTYEWVDKPTVLQIGPADGGVYAHVNMPCSIELNRCLVARQRTLHEAEPAVG